MARPLPGGGSARLTHQTGARAQAGFFPLSSRTLKALSLALLHVLHRAPAGFGYEESRWSLQRLLNTCDWLQLGTLGGLSQLLRRLGIRFKHARDYVHSPDEHYQAKLDRLQPRLLQARYDPAHYVFLFLDEFTYYRQPSLARAYAAAGHAQPLAQRSYRSNTSFRIIAALNALTGQVTYPQHYPIDLPQLGAFYQQLSEVYPERQIYLVEDNWPVHFHPEVLARLQPQHFPWPPKLPANWPSQPSAKAVHANLPIQVLCLPTYASWCNPIEKLWRWLQQDILHLHRQSDAWDTLKQRVAGFLDGFGSGSDPLLRYVGLLPD